MEQAIKDLNDMCGTQADEVWRDVLELQMQVLIQQAGEGQEEAITHADVVQTIYYLETTISKTCTKFKISMLHLMQLK